MQLRTSPGGAFVLLVLTIALLGANGGHGTIERISVDYPSGGTRLLVQRDGQAFLAYGALPQLKPVRKGTFDVDALYAQLRMRLHDNAPRETWPDPRSTYGMVHITWTNGVREEHLLFDEESFTSELFDRARKNPAKP